MIELDPLYVDVAIARWERSTGSLARRAGSGRTFIETAAERGLELLDRPEPGSKFAKARKGGER